MISGGEGGAHASTAAQRGLQHRLEDDQPVGGAHQRLGGALGMGHHAHHVALAVEHAGDVAQRAVGVVDVAEGDAVLGFEFVERALVGDVAAFAVGDRQAQHLVLLRGGGVGRVGGAHREAQFAADELQAAIADQRAGKQAGLHQDLEAVADAEHEPAIGGELADGLHDGRELGDGPAAEVIAVGEAAGENHGIDIAERGRVVPDELRRLPEIVGDRVKSIVIAIASGKNNDAKFHGFCFRGAVVFILPEAAAGQRAERHAVRGGTGRVTEAFGSTASGGSGRAKLRLMRTPACVAASLLFLWSVAAPAEPAKFAGTWEAAHEGKVFLVLKIQAGAEDLRHVERRQHHS